MGHINLLKGDLFIKSCDVFQGDTVVLCHGVNCVGVMGAGIAVKFKKVFPKMYSAYKSRCKNGLLASGDVWYWSETSSSLPHSKQPLGQETTYHVYNLAVKDHWRLPATYNAVESAFFKLVEMLEARGIKAIAMPWVGCGLGGLEQSYVKKIMEKALKDKDITFYVCEL